MAMTGDDVMPRIVALLRDNADDEKAPYLLRCWEPSCMDPFSGGSLMDKPLAPYQSRQARQAILQKPPLSLSAQAAQQTAAYRGRHPMPIVAGDLKLDSRHCAALSNWRDCKDSPAKQLSTAMSTFYDLSLIHI